MKLVNYINESNIFLNLNFTTKEELLNSVSEWFSKSKIVTESTLDFNKILDSLQKREKVISTGLGKGIAIPHARIDGLSDIVVILGILNTPLEFDSIDNLPIDLFAGVLIPQDQPAKGLKVMAQFSRFFLEQAPALRQARSKDVIFSLIKNNDFIIEEPLLAREVMVDPPFFAKPDTPLKDITKQMELYHMNSVPVVDDENKLKGEILLTELFNIGIPDFFKSLKTVSFVSYFDPFEEYFKNEATFKASDVMTPIKADINNRSTILEIVFALTIKNNPTLFVTDSNNKLLGMIDQNTVMNRIINY